MQVSDFVEKYVTFANRLGTDFAGQQTAWINYINLFLEDLENEGIKHLGASKVAPLWVTDSYYAIVPSDFQDAIDITYPFDQDKYEHNWPFEILDNQIAAGASQKLIKLVDAFTYGEDNGTQYTVEDPGVSAPSTSYRFNDSDLDVEADEIENYMIKWDNGTNSGDCAIIKSNLVTAADLTTIDFIINPYWLLDSTLATITDEYLLLRYRSEYTRVTAYTSELPFDRAYNALKCWLDWQTTPIKDKAYDKRERQYDKQLAKLRMKENTPKIDQARPEPRELLQYE